MPRELAKGQALSPLPYSRQYGSGRVGHDKHAVREPLGATSHRRVAQMRDGQATTRSLDTDLRFSPQE